MRPTPCALDSLSVERRTPFTNTISELIIHDNKGEGNHLPKLRKLSFLFLEESGRGDEEQRSNSKIVEEGINRLNSRSNSSKILRRSSSSPTSINEKDNDKKSLALYKMFCLNNRAALQEKEPHVTNRTISRRLVVLWNKMTTEEKRALASGYSMPFL